MERKSVAERLEEHKKRKSTGGNNTTGDTTANNTRTSVSERLERHKLEKNVGLDTFDSDLASANDTINKVYSGWQNADYMKSAKGSVSSMYDRINSYKSYVNRNSDEDLTEFNKSMDELLTGYQTALNDWDNIAGAYGRYKDADSYTSETKKLSELYSMSKDDLASYLENDNPVAYTTFGGQDITWQSLYDEKLHKEMATSTKGKQGWEKYLADELKAFQTSKEESEDKKWYEWLGETLGGVSDTTLPGATMQQVVSDKREDTSYMKPTDDWTREEKNIFGAYYLSDPEKAYEYATNLNNAKNRAKKNEKAQEVVDSATSGFLEGAGHTAGAILSAPLGLADYLDDLTDIAANRPIIEESMLSPFEYSQAVTGGIGSKLNEDYGTIDESVPVIGGKGLGDVYGLGTSILQSGLSVNLLGPTGTLVSYFGQGAASGVDDALSRGASDEQALLYGGILGAAEGISEHIGADKLLKIGASDTLKELLVNTFKQAGAEGLEEAFSSFAGQVADNFVMQDNSNFEKAVRTYVTNGMSEEEAKKKAWLDSFESVAYDALGGFISGGVHAVPQTLVQTYETHKQNADLGSTIRDNNNVEELGRIASELNNDSYKKYLDLLNSEKISDANLGKLYTAVEKNASERFTAESADSEMRTIANRANELGDSKNSGIIASAIQKKLSGNKLNESERAALKLDTAKTIMQEIERGEISVKLSDSAVNALNTVNRTNTLLTTKKSEDAAQAEQRANEMHTGDRTVDAEGNEIHINGITADENGNTVVMTEQGEQSIDDVTLTDNDALAVAYAEQMEETKANAFLANYDGKASIEDYKASFDLAYSYGEKSYGSESVLRNLGVLTEAQAKDIYELGVKNATEVKQQRLDEITHKHFANRTDISPGKFDDSAVNYANLNSRQKDAVYFAKILSHYTGVNVVFFESVADENGKRTEENGRYEKQTNTIYIDAYAGMNEGIVEDAIVPTLSHELTHWMKGKAVSAYSDLSEVVMNTLTEEFNCTPEALIETEKARYRKIHNAELSDEGAMDELIARTCEDMLSNSKTMQEYLSFMDKKNANTFMEKVKEIVDSLKEWFAKLLSVYKSNSNEAKIIRKYAERLNDLQDSWDEGMYKAIKSNQAMEAENQQEASYSGVMTQSEELSDMHVHYSRREEAPPTKTGIAYKCFLLKNGELFPPMVANPNGEGTPVGVWLNADAAPRAEDSKTGRPKVQAGGKGTNVGKTTLAYRPGWHLGDIPQATQFSKLNKETGLKELFPSNFVWAECEYAMDVDYQEEAMSYGYNKNGNFQHSLAGLPKIPKDGYYRYRTNPNPDTVPWVITGAMKVNRILTDAETDAICRENGVEPMKRLGGPLTEEKLADMGLTQLQYSDREITPLSESDYRKLKEFFGTTQNPKFAGYMLKDGAMLDFSGKHWGNPVPTAREVDHRDIWDVWNNMDRDGTDEMVNMIGNGNIRLMPETGGINLSVKPTLQQIDTLKKYIDFFHGEVVVDFDAVGGDTVETYTYSNGASASKIIDDINTYFKGGRRSELAQFHTQFSERDSEGNGLSAEQVEFFKNSKVRDDNGNLLVMYHGTPNQGFTVFRQGSYFTNDLEYAELYKAQGTKRTANAPGVYTVYLNIKKPFDLTDSEAQKAYKEFIKEGLSTYINPSTPDADIDDIIAENDLDWNEADDLTEFLQDNDYDYDGIRFKEREGIYSYMTFFENQIKDIGNSNPTEDEDIRYSDRENIDLSAELATYNLEGKWNDYKMAQREIVNVLRSEGYFNNNSIINKDYGMEVRITPKGIKETIGPEKRFQYLARELKELKVATLRYLPDIIENGKMVNPDEMNYHDANGDRFAYIESDAVIDGVKYGVRVSVKKKVGSNVFWIHQVDTKKDSDLLTPSDKKDLKENQNHSATLTQKEDDVNIFFADRETESIYELVGELERVKKENVKLKKDVERLRDKIKLEKSLTGGFVLNESQVGSVASYLLGNAKSNYSKESLVADLKEVYRYLQSDEVQWDILMSKATDAANKIVAKAKPEVVVNDYAKNVLKVMRETRVSLNDVQKQEAAYNFGKDWYKRFFGKVLIANDGIPLDSVWQEWAAQYPDVFDADTSDADMVPALVDAYESLRAAAEVVEDFDRAEMARDIAIEIYNQFWNISPVRTAADKHDREIKQLKYEHRMEMQEMKARYNQKKTEAVYRTKEHYKNAIQKLKDKQADEIKKVRDKDKEYRDAYKDRLNRRSEIDKITQKALKLNSWLKKNSKEEHIPEILKPSVAYFLNALNYSSERLLGLHENWKNNGVPTQKDVSLSKAFENLEKMVTDVSGAQFDDSEIDGMYGYLDLPAEFIEHVTKTREEVNDILREVGDNEMILNQMSLEQLKRVKEIITTLTHIVTTMNRTLADANGKSIAYLAQQTMLYCYNLKDKSKHVGKFTDFFNFDNALPYYAFKRFGDGGKAIFTGLQDGWDKLAFNTKQIIDYAEATYDGADAKNWSEELHEFEILNGTDRVRVRMNTAQIMSLYCTQKREQAKGHLTGGGIRVADFKNGRGTVSQPDGVVLTDSDIADIISVLTEKQIKVADKLQDFMNNECAEWGNYISMKRFGYKAFGEENYFPITSDTNNTGTEDPNDRKNTLFRLLNMSFTKATINKANNRIVIDNIFDVFANHTSDMAKYNALALPVLDAFKWYNYKEKVKVNPQDKSDTRFNTHGTKQALEKAYGAGAKQYFVRFLEDLNGASSGGVTSGEGFAKKMMSNYKVAAVAGNIRVALLQPTAFLRTGVVLNPKYLTKALANKPQVKKAQETCGIALWKSLGFYDVNISKGVTDLIKHEETVADKIKDKSLWLVEKGDSITWGYIYNACLEETKDKNPRLKGKELDDAVAKRFREVIYSTQVVDSTMTRTQMMRSKSTMSQMLTAFMSEPMVSYNLLLDCYTQYNADLRSTGSKSTAFKRNGKKIARAVFAYMVTTFATGFIGAIPDALRDDDEEKEFLDKFFVAGLENVGSDVFSMIPIWKDMYSIMQGYSSTRMDEQFMSSIWSAVKKLTDGEFNYKDVYSTAKAISQVTGLPISNIMREVVTIWNNTVGETYPSIKLK